MRALYEFFSLLLYLQIVNTADINLNKNKPECKKDQNLLANAQMQFVHCTVTNSVPVQICNKCIAEYDEMAIAYTTITNNPNCTEIFFDKDRINIMSTMQGLLNGLWAKAYCDDCFSSNNSEIFDTKWGDWNECVNIAPTNEVCIECEIQYEDLNTFYKGLDLNNKGKVCYDLQDKMNRTRSDWSNSYKCCKRVKNLTYFLIVTGIFALFPLIFYSGAYIITKRQERNHGLLNEHEPGLDGPSIATLIAAAIIATPTTPPSTAASSSTLSSRPPLHTAAADVAAAPPPPPPVKSKYAPIQISDSDSDDFPYAAAAAKSKKP